MWGLVFQSESVAGDQATPPNFSVAGLTTSLFCTRELLAGLAGGS